MVLAEYLERLKAQDKTPLEAVSAKTDQSRAAFKGKPASLLRASFHSGKHYKRLKQM